ncbi:MAG TPA: DUF4832 domain-containing protein [Humisphaera sp.]
MRRTARQIATLVLLAAACASRAAGSPPTTAPAAAGDAVTVVPAEDARAVLHNPDMGWVLYENYPLDQRPGGSSTLVTLPGEAFAGVDHVALMFSWADVEREPGRYDFAKVDHAYDHWAKRGKAIQLRMSTESLLWWANATPPAGQGVPDHVLARIPADRKQRRTCEGIGYTVVDARDPAYLAALEKFLAAVAAHFDASRPVTLVDLRGFGLWGEWHTGFRYATVDDRRAALAGVIDRYAKAFPAHRVALSYSYDPDSPKRLWDGPTDRYDEAFTQHYDEFLRYSAFDHALTLPNVTFRRDGAGGAVRSNERRLCEQAFVAGRGPMMSEFVDGYAASKRGRPGWVERKVNDALSLHPNYVNLLGWQGCDALAFLRERRDLVDDGLRRMGYRLVSTAVTHPRRCRAGGTLRVATQWVNRGVGRALRDYTLRASLADAAGKVVASADVGTMGTAGWVAGRTYDVAGEFAVPLLAAGEYELRLSVVDPGTKRTIRLPLAGGTNDGSYAVGRLTVDAARP